MTRRSAPGVIVVAMLLATEDMLGAVSPIGYVGAVLVALAGVLFALARVPAYTNQRSMLEGRAVFIGGVGAVVVLADAAVSVTEAHTRFAAIVVFVVALAVVAQLGDLRRRRLGQQVLAREGNVDGAQADRSTEA